MTNDPNRSQRLNFIRQRLLKQEAILSTGIAVLLLIGVPMLFIGPIVVGFIFWIVTIQLFGYISLTWFLVGSCILLIPLLLWTERRAHGGSFDQAVLGNPSGINDAALAPFLLGSEFGMIIAIAANPRVTVSGLVEIFLTGPRFVLEAWDKHAAMKRLKNVDRDIASDVIDQLCQNDRAIAVKEFIKAYAPKKCDVSGPIAYLLFHDWIGISKEMDRIWLHSEGKKRLAG
jgi:hypothetical protein